MNRQKFLLAVNFLNVFGFALWGPLYSVYATRQGANIAVVGALFAGYTVIDGLMILLFGRLTTPANRSKVLAAGYLTQGLGALIFAMSSGVGGIAISLAVLALGSGMIAPSWKALYTRTIEEVRSASLWSYYDAGNTFVIAAGSAIAGWIAFAFGFRPLFMLMAAVELLAAVAVLRVGYTETKQL